MGKRANGTTLSSFALEVSEKIGTLQAQTQENVHRLERVEQGLGGVAKQLEAFDGKLVKHQQEEYSRFDKLGDTIKEVQGSIQGLSAQVQDPKISKRSLWAAAAGIIMALTAIIGVALYLFDVLAKP